jgi:hypothetical protein
MPNYIYQHPETKEYIEIFQSMKEDHVYFDGDGTEWSRVLIAPQLNTEAPIDPWNKGDFINKTANSKGSYGDLLDRSKELSDKRASEHGGVDPVKQKYFDNYAKKRKGQRHLNEKRTVETKNIKIDL